MNRSHIITFACHAVACLLFPIATTLGFRTYTALFGAPFARGAAIGLAAELIFVAFALVNGLIALVPSIKAKIVIACALVFAVLFYLLPEHPLRGLFFAGLSGGLSLLAIYISSLLTKQYHEL